MAKVVSPVVVSSTEQTGELALQSSVDALTERTSAGFKAAQAKISALNADNTALRELVSTLMSSVTTLTTKVAQLERKLTEVGSETRKDKFLTALRELVAERGLPVGTNLPATEIEARMRVIESRKQLVAPALMAPVTEEVLF